MKPLDPRLLRHVKSARLYILMISLMGVIAAILVFIQTVTLSNLLTPVIEGQVTWKEFIERPTPILILAAALLARVVVVYLRETIGQTAANRIISELRYQVITTASKLGSRWLTENATNTATLSTRGLDALVPYCVKYLPQLLLTMTVTPMALLVMLWFDWWSALIALASIPLIPIFMILVGKLTQKFSDQKIKVMEELGSQVLDLLSGLVTMKALGREKGPEKSISEIGRKYTDSTMATLRLAFLSGAILEFISTLAVALVAVEVGMRLVFGSIDLYAGLIVIMLAPEVYNPLRQVGVQFHASSDGVAAINQALEIIEQNTGSQPGKKSPRLSNTDIIISDASVEARGRYSPHRVNARIKSNQIVALTGPSGVGKTTLAMAIMGFQKLDIGNIAICREEKSIDISELSPESLQSELTWVPQSPIILPGTALQSIDPHATEVTLAIQKAAESTGFDQVVANLKDGWDTQLGHNGVGLSVGQRQRLALTRALVSSRPLVILDEPTAHLDTVSEQQIVEVIKKLKAQGSTVIVIAHRDAVIEVADQLIPLQSQPLPPSHSKPKPDEESKTEDDTQTEIDTFFTLGGAA